MIPLVVSDVLREATELKIEETEQDKEVIKKLLYGANLANLGENDLIKRLPALIEHVKDQFPSLENDDGFDTLNRYIQQAKDDRCISEEKLQKLEQQYFGKKWAVFGNRLDVTSLHVDLLKESLRAQDSAETVAARLEEAALDDDFELIVDELEAVYESFEKNAFASKEINAEAVETYLSNLFENPEVAGALQYLRSANENFANDFREEEDVDDELLIWCIFDLLENGLISDDIKHKLHGYLQSPMTIRELRSIINTKSIQHWNWRNADRGLKFTTRQNDDGKYCIVVEEGIIDMLFLHTVATRWSIKLKSGLKQLINHNGVWPRNAPLTTEEAQKREYYLHIPQCGLVKPRRKKKAPAEPVPVPTVCTLCHGPPPPPVFIEVPPPPPPIFPCPPPPPQAWKPKKKKKLSNFPLLPPMPEGFGLHYERHRDYIKDFFLSRLPSFDGSAPKVESANETKANLMKRLATEFKLREALDGKANGVFANFQSFALTLPHEVVLVVLKFIGVPKLWLDFFTRFLEAPLNMGPASGGSIGQVIKRTCGVPVAHSLELFFSEAVLFFLDLAVHQATGGYLYRLRDKCYFVGSADQDISTVSQIHKFANIMGLSVDIRNNACAEPIGLLDFRLHPGQPLTFALNTTEMQDFAHRLKKQLSSCPTVLEWIRVWNASMGTYASHLFGPLANVFGKPHLEAVTKAHNHIFKVIFGGQTLTAHLTKLLETHLGRTFSSPPFALEALMYLPTAYGGLGVKNPYITINLAREVSADPNSVLAEYLDNEKEYYERAAARFNALDDEVRTARLESIFDNDPAHIRTVLGAQADPAAFIPFSELTALRERVEYVWLPPNGVHEPPCAPPRLVSTYNSLLCEPINDIEANEQVSDEVRSLAGRDGMKRWSSLSSEDKWVLQLYSEECFEMYGGLEVWLPAGVPLEALKMVRGSYGEEEDDDDDDSSYVSDYTEV